ncbi:MAG: recombinase family protein, partial [Bacilli bacterium]
WYKTTIDSILTNEKYRGDALLQKRFTVNFLEHKLKKNQGEVPQYYVENSHDPIIDPFEWDLVQRELDRRAELGKSYSSKSIFSSKLVCEECGGFYGQKLWHSNTKYRRFIWQCNEKFKRDDARCKTPLLDTETIKQMFLIAYNQLMENRNDVIVDCKMIMNTLVDFEKLERQMNEQVQETEVVANLVKNLVKENASTPKSQEEYLSKYEVLQLR